MSADQRIKRICLTCDNEFMVSPSKVKNGRGIYCSKKCLYSSVVMKEIATDMGHANLGKVREPFTEEHKLGISEGLKISRWGYSYCGYMYRDKYGFLTICKNAMKKNKRSCGKHMSISQRYFPSKINPQFVIDITL